MRARSRDGAEIGRPKTRRTMPLWNDYQRFLAWSKKLPDKKTFRIAYVRPYNDHFFAAAPVYNKIGAYKVGFTPCTNFIYKPDIADPELYKLINVKYVVSIGRLGHSYLERVRSFVGADARGGIGDHHPQAMCSDGRVEADRAAFIGMAHRIGQQVADHQSQRDAINANGLRPFAALQRQPAPRRRLGQRRPGGVDELAQDDRLKHDIRSVAEASQIQKRLHRRLHLKTDRQRLIGKRAVRLGRARPRERKLKLGAQTRERRAQFMGGRVGEGLFALHEALQPG